jgi:hypothetical protein
MQNAQSVETEKKVTKREPVTHKSATAASLLGGFRSKVSAMVNKDAEEGGNSESRKKDLAIAAIYAEHSAQALESLRGA